MGEGRWSSARMQKGDWLHDGAIPAPKWFHYGATRYVPPARRRALQGSSSISCRVPGATKDLLGLRRQPVGRRHGLDPELEAPRGDRQAIDDLPAGGEAAPQPHLDRDFLSRLHVDSGLDREPRRADRAEVELGLVLDLRPSPRRRLEAVADPTADLGLGV